MADDNNEWPREPGFRGFYTDYGPITSSTRKIVEPSTGAVIRYSVSRNQWDERSPRIRRIRAYATLPQNRAPACWMRFDLLDDGGQELDDSELWYACDAMSASLERLASALIEATGSGVTDVFDLGPVLHFERLEVHQELRGTGLGVLLAQAVLAEFVNRFKPSLLLLCPYPLQFENCAPGESSDSKRQTRFKRALDTNRRKLARLYEREFGVVRLCKGGDYWATALPGFRLMQSKPGWAVWYDHRETAVSTTACV